MKITGSELIASLTIRQYIAGQVIGGLLASPHIDTIVGEEPIPSVVTRITDALIKELNKDTYEKKDNSQ